MASKLAEWFGLRTRTVDLIGSGAEKLKTVAEFLGDAAEKISDQLDQDHGTSVTAALEFAAPWADMLGDIVPPVKLLAKILQKVTTINEPEVLGLLACNAAYQRAIEEAVKETPEKDAAASEPAPSRAELKSQASQLRKQFADSEITTELSFRWFSLEQPLAHPFAVNSRRVLEYYARILYGDDTKVRRLVVAVEQKFPTVLKLVLSDRELAPKFAPFKSLVELGTGEERLAKALERHSNYQQWLFDAAAVLGQEPFPLKEIYVAPDCGELGWAAIRDIGRATKLEDRIDPFLESCGGRHALLERVLALISDNRLKDPIVIQGAAGSGKSSFTLHLSSVLRSRGLIPVRVRFRDLPPKQEFFEALCEAILANSGEVGGTEGLRFSAGEMRFDPAILDGSVEFDGTRICPYILIFDGWDEISVSASHGFKARVESIIEDIVSRLVDKVRAAPVRVIISGRPSVDVSENRRLRARTPVLTMRPLTPTQLAEFARKLAKARAAAGQEVTVLTEALITELEAEYSRQYTVAIAEAKPGAASLSGSFAVFGLPLLAYLSLRLIAHEKTRVSALAQNPTELYRKLVNLTSASAANVERMDFEAGARLYGGPLRELLRKTAVAMTIRGGESISYDELESRLNVDGALEPLVRETTADNPLSELMISYYFRAGNRELGCEFLHKSFREYLFAEAIVETVKAYGRTSDGTASPRSTYWREFDSPDSRVEFGRSLGTLLGAQWLTTEVCGHMEQLIEWEIDRSALVQEKKANTPVVGEAIPLQLDEWRRARDGLADLWEWWSEGVPVRPQPSYNQKSAALEYKEPLAYELVQTFAPRDLPKKQLPVPVRVTTIDGHLGDGLFRLTALVHYCIAVKTGWLDLPHGSEVSRPAQLWAGVSVPGERARKYQIFVERGNRSWVLFAPSGDDARFIGFGASRINAAGWRPHGAFPGGVDVRGVYLRGCELTAPGSNFAGQRPTKLDHANLESFSGSQTVFSGLSAVEIYAPKVEMYLSAIFDSNFSGADLKGAGFAGSFLLKSNFSGANLTDANLNTTYLQKVNFSGARLTKASFRLSTTSEVNFEGADRTDADFTQAQTLADETFAPL
jgi:uncharacterized protein YjbI with pentapeptide repeats